MSTAFWAQLPAADMDSISVSQLNNYIRKVVGAQDVLRRVCVFGEVSSFKYSGPHAYFTLKDADAAISCSCFNGRKTYNPTKEGESVLCVGSVDYYVKGGRLSLVVDTIQPVGAGKLHVMLEALKAKLAKEGLFAVEHKKPIPPYCKRVCVVTSKTGAVIRDIVRTVRRVNDVLDIDVFDVRVQGEQAAAEMCRALQFVDTLGYDCVILARGGGSFEDLMPFNDEQLARVIYAMNTPIISAVGHETDYSISDWVADARSATPTAAAALVAYDVGAIKAQIVRYMEGAYNRLQGVVQGYSDRFAHLAGALSDKSMLRLTRAEHAVRRETERLKVKCDNLMVIKKQRLDTLMTALSAANPVKLLQNGYCRLSKDGAYADYDTIAVGDKVDVVASGGTLTCQVTQKTDRKPIREE